MVKIGLNYYIRASKAIISLYNLYIDYLYAPCKDIGKYSIQLFLLDINLPTDTKEDLNLII